MRNIKTLAIHVSATSPTMTAGPEKVWDWHVNGNGWRDIGYHYYITRDGRVHKGRDESAQGAHVGGHNAASIGICLEGGLRAGGNPTNRADFVDNIKPEQKASLRTLLIRLMSKYDLDISAIKGHNEYPGHETRGCPVIDMDDFRGELEELIRLLPPWDLLIAMEAVDEDGEPFTDWRRRVFKDE